MAQISLSTFGQSAARHLDILLSLLENDHRGDGSDPHCLSSSSPAEVDLDRALARPRLEGRHRRATSPRESAGPITQGPRRPHRGTCSCARQRPTSRLPAQLEGAQRRPPQPQRASRSRLRPTRAAARPALPHARRTPEPPPDWLEGHRDPRGAVGGSSRTPRCSDRCRQDGRKGHSQSSGLRIRRGAKHAWNRGAHPRLHAAVCGELGWLEPGSSSGSCACPVAEAVDKAAGRSRRRAVLRLRHQAGRLGARAGGRWRAKPTLTMPISRGGRLLRDGTASRRPSKSNKGRLPPRPHWFFAGRTKGYWRGGFIVVSPKDHKGRHRDGRPRARTRAEGQGPFVQRRWRVDEVRPRSRSRRA